MRTVWRRASVPTERQMCSDSGFTLVETMVAMVILAIVLAGLAGGAIAGLTSVRHEKDQLAANQFANEIVEQVRAQQWDSVAPADPAVTRTLTFPARRHGGTEIVPTVVTTWWDDPCNGSSLTPAAGGAAHASRDYLRIAVDLTWTTAKGRSASLSTQSFRTPAYSERKPARVDTLGASC
jgi:uncharacterized protein (TIGR02598 family)